MGLPRLVRRLRYRRLHMAPIALRTKLVILNGMDEVEVWSDAVVLLFIQYRLLGDLMGLKTALRCLPLHAKAVAAEEKSYWARFLRLKVLAELRLLGISKPGPYVPLPSLPPFAPMGVFAPRDLSAATSKAQAKALLETELYNKMREDHDAEVAAIIARHVGLRSACEGISDYCD